MRNRVLMTQNNDGSWTIVIDGRVADSLAPDETLGALAEIVIAGRLPRFSREAGQALEWRIKHGLDAAALVKVLTTARDAGIGAVPSDNQGTPF